MSTRHDGFEPSTRSHTLRNRAARMLVVFMVMLSSAFGVARVGFAQDSTSITETPVADSSTTVNSVNGNATFSVADVAEQANAAVVTIYTYVNATQTQPSTDTFGQQRPSQQQPSTDDSTDATDDSTASEAYGAGSGWIYDAEGHVVTNNHVVEGADSFVVQFYDGTQVNATLVGTDSFQDVAVLQLDLEDGQTVPGVATVGDSTAMRAGDQVVAIGSPLGEFTNSVSEGIIGGLDRSLDTGEGYALANLIQHDAPISPGNSGGPLLNMNGEVIGMNVAKVEYQQAGEASATGLNFAIDGNTVKEIVDEILTNDGNVVFPYLGVSTQTLTDGTVQVGQVATGGPSEEAGIQVGDVITQIDGEDLTTNDPLLNQLFQHKPGDTVTLTIERNGETLTIDVVLGERPSDA